MAQKEEFRALTGLRGFAALWVVSYHFSRAGETLLPGTSSLSWLTGAGFQAVPLFFILSGFILLHTYRDRFEVFTGREYFRFLGLRLARIYPAYLAALAVMVLLVVVAQRAGVPHEAGAYPWSILGPEGLMLHQWLPTKAYGWNSPDWSVSAEWFAYLAVFPLAVWLVKQLAGRNAGLVIAVLLTLCALEPVLRADWRLSMVSLLFLVGALLWELRRRRASRGLPLPPQLDLLGAGLLLVVLGFAPEHEVLVLLALALLVLGLSRGDGLVARLLATRPAVFLGEISYSLYLSHAAVQKVLKVALPFRQFAGESLLLRVGVGLTYAVCVLAAGALLYFAVERPARTWLRRRYLND